MNIAQPVAPRVAFAGVFLVRIAQLHQFRVAIERVVIHGDFAVQRDQLVLAGNDQRVDLGQAGVGADKDLIEILGCLLYTSRCV